MPQIGDQMAQAGSRPITPSEEEEAEAAADAAWFEHAVTPKVIASYKAAPPRGMSNPPQNPKVRRALLQDLMEIGNTVEVSDWPPQPRPMAQTAPSNWPTGPTAAAAAAPAASPSRTAAVRAALLARWPQPASSSSGGGNDHKARSMTPLGVSSSAPAFRGRQMYHPVWHSCTLAPPKSQRQARRPRASWRQGMDPGSLEPRSGSGGSDRRHSSARRMSESRWSLDGPDAPGEAGQEPSGSAKGRRRGVRSAVDDTSLDNARHTLKGQSQLHRAALADRFRFGAENCLPGTPIILGLSTANATKPAAWATDASYLNNFHHAAIRVVDPSGLQALDEAAWQKKKKKGKVPAERDDVDDLKMSDSGLFVARYPIDESLKSLRRLRRNLFPKEEKVEKKKAVDGPWKVAAMLKQDLRGGMMLSNVRESAKDELHARETAVKMSGYE